MSLPGIASSCTAAGRPSATAKHHFFQLPTVPCAINMLRVRAVRAVVAAAAARGAAVAAAIGGPASLHFTGAVEVSLERARARAAQPSKALQAAAS